VTLAEVEVSLCSFINRVYTLRISFLSSYSFFTSEMLLFVNDSVCTLQVLSQDEIPFLYSLVLGEGVLKDAIQHIDLGNFSTFVSHSNSLDT
jgi:sodium/hydrogen exchanger 8